jgi:hypothetical protein
MSCGVHSNVVVVVVVVVVVDDKDAVDDVVVVVALGSRVLLKYCTSPQAPKRDT